MPEIEIRPATVNDLRYVVKIEHSYQTMFVWQMDRSIQDGQININFRQTRLPRTVRVDYAGSHPLLNEENWPRYQAVLVATVAQIPVGYIGMSDQFASKAIWITDCAVKEDYRRQGIGTTLILAAQEWGIEQGFRKAILEMQSKNYPAVQLARKLGYEFCGYNDHYFPNQDIALFFSRSLR
ncbi:MAG: GNAT family N-acetyltransferase [Anaerolineaceae bacterium]|nr:GNAT family N-acetyltransferase [Anaerolineaceae bacterium]